MKTALSITGLGLLTPVGLSPMTCMHAVRTGVTRLALQPIPDRVQQWIGGGRVPWWTQFNQTRHLEALARAAIAQAWQYATMRRPDAAPRRVAVLVGAPEPGRPGFSFPETDGEGLDFIDSLGLAGVVHGGVVRAGPCHGHVALQRAAELFERNLADACVIASADSLLQIRAVRWLEDQSRLKCSYVTDGLMPAEGAACMVVEPEWQAVRRGAPTIATVVSVASAHEPANILSDQGNTAGGLTTAARAALFDASIEASDLAMVWSDLNGESYRAREWAFTEVRLGVQTRTELQHPADCHGDLGATTDANLLSLAAMSLGTGWTQGRPCLVFAGSESGLRVASVLTGPGPAPSLARVSFSIPQVLAARFVVPDAPIGADAEDLNDPLRVEFDWQVREGHREDLASLYYQRRAMRHEAAVPWRRLADVEQRMLNHVDAITVLGAEAIATVCAGLCSDEEGDAWAGATMIGVLPVALNYARLDEALTNAPLTRLAGIGDALVHAPSAPALSTYLDRWLGDDRPEIRRWALRLVGARVEPGKEREVVRLLGDPETAAAACRAVGRLLIIDAASALEPLLEDPHEAVRVAALEALLVVEPATTRSQCLRTLRHVGDPSAARCLAILGRPEDAPLLAQRASEPGVDPSLIESLGILGAPSTVPLLLELLDVARDEVKTAAARSLMLLSGAALWETVLLPAEDPDDDGIPSRRPNTSVSEWRRWWEQARNRATGVGRLRNGDSFTLESCLLELQRPDAGLADRARSHLELLVLSGARLPFDSRWFVSRQEGAIAAWRAWLGRGRSRHQGE